MTTPQQPQALFDPGPRPSGIAPRPCISCRYDVSSLSDDARCPECGTPIRDTAHPARMLDWDAHSLQHLATSLAGAALVATGVAILSVLNCITSAGASWRTHSQVPSSWPAAVGCVVCLVAAASTALWLMALKPCTFRFRPVAARRCCLIGGGALVVSWGGLCATLASTSPRRGALALEPVLLVIVITAAAVSVHLASATLALRTLSLTLGKQGWARAAAWLSLASIGPALQITSTGLFLAMAYVIGFRRPHAMRESMMDLARTTCFLGTPLSIAFLFGTSALCLKIRDLALASLQRSSPSRPSS